jgi:ABC-2 type transport system permease protein
MFETVTYYDNKIVKLNVTTVSNSKYEVSISYLINKYEKKNNAKTLLPLNDFIEIGIYKKGSFLPVEIKIVWVNKSNNQLKFQLDYIPERIAIDPHCLLIDIKRSDNNENF